VSTNHLSRLLESARPVVPKGLASSPVSLHIERLSLIGLPFSSAESQGINRAAQRELARLMESHRWPEGAGGYVIPSLPATTLTLDDNSSPSRVGRDLARCVFAAVRDER
jgi:hypothetical protein